MVSPLSPRLRAIADALPLKPGIRILEIGCGPGALVRQLALRVEHGFVLGIDRSANAIRQAVKSSAAEIAAGRLNFQQCAIEDFLLPEGLQPFDIAVAIRVGALDGRHSELAGAAFQAIAAALKPGGNLFIDGGDPLQIVSLQT